MKEFKPEDLLNFCVKLGEFIQEKNRRYGNSVGKPLQVFYRGDAEQQMLSRIDEKISRIKNSEELRQNDVVDLMGHLAILCVYKGWEDLEKFLD